MMRQGGIEVAIAVLKRLDSPLEMNLRATGIPFLPCSGSNVYSPLHVWALAKHIVNFDVVHSYLFPAQLWVAAAARLAGKHVPVVTSEPSTSNNRRTRKWTRRLDVWMYRHYRKIACNSEATAGHLRRWAPEVSDRITIISNGVPVERFAEAVAANKAKILPGVNGRPLVMFVARFDPAKDHPTLLRAMCKVPEADLVLIGDGDSRPAMQRFASHLGIGDRVHFLGKRPDVPQLLKLANLYVHASNFEGFGIAAAEAMSAGLPVIASDVPGLNEVVRGAGVLVPPGDENALAAAIRNILRSSQIRQGMAVASKKRATNFNINATVASLVKLYESVANM
jgi:glycosyltransferase involved in cell wall biosynthesis